MKNITKKSLALASLLFATSASLAVAQPNPDQKRRNLSSDSSNTTMQHHYRYNHSRSRNFDSFGISSNEWEALSIEDARKLKVFIVQFGLMDQPHYTNRRDSNMQYRFDNDPTQPRPSRAERSTEKPSQREERSSNMQKSWSETPEEKKEREIFQAKVFKLWEVAAFNFDIGPYSSERMPNTLARMQAQEERLERWQEQSSPDQDQERLRRAEYRLEQQKESMSNYNRFLEQQNKSH